MNNEIRLLVLLLTIMLAAGFLAGSLTVITLTEDIPTCQEDEVMARRPYPDGPLVCLHIEELQYDLR